MGFAAAGLSFALAAVLYVGFASRRQPSLMTIALLNEAWFSAGFHFFDVMPREKDSWRPVGRRPPP